jgi:muramidase (phage lysozyme)
LLKGTGSLTDVKKGRFAEAINKNKSIWASLPGDVHGQGGKNSAQALAYYKQGGGTVVG